jgi:hypothetical protein
LCSPNISEKKIFFLIGTSVPGFPLHNGASIKKCSENQFELGKFFSVWLIVSEKTESSKLGRDRYYKDVRAWTFEVRRLGLGRLDFSRARHIFGSRNLFYGFELGFLPTKP